VPPQWASRDHPQEPDGHRANEQSGPDLASALAADEERQDIQLAIGERGAAEAPGEFGRQFWRKAGFACMYLAD
jgi:hypothetical protein